MKKIIPLLVLHLIVFVKPISAQLKFVIEDFEGFSNNPVDMKINGIFTFGNSKAYINETATTLRTQPDYFGERYISIKNEVKKEFGGWGKGIGLNVELDAAKDYLNFYVYQAPGNAASIIKIQLQEDDNDNQVYEKQSDDAWIYTQEIKNSVSESNWQLISIPLSKFKDDNEGGDGVFNCSYKSGKLFCFLVSFVDPQLYKAGQTISFDFICFTEGALNIRAQSFNVNTNYCSLGLWSKEGSQADFTEIGKEFQETFIADSKKKLGVIHLFQPFAIDGRNTQNLYPSVERINNIIKEGYIPMITLENHFILADKNMKQPNLYSIVEGHFDSFFGYWANQIKQVKGTVLLRILHEFNGDWYPWCVANNDKDPKLLIKAYCYIHNIFKENNVTNVKFIWCPNSMSVPQEKWNYIMDAYPGDAYVDYVGMDIYNGAGQKSPIWVSFRKVGIENYFILSKQLSQKPMLICETASREREITESKKAQTKAGWIKQQSEVLKYEMPKVKLITWFNEKGTFKINSSPDAKSAFLNYIVKDNYFKSGTSYLLPVKK